jgi:hypothetical protein
MTQTVTIPIEVATGQGWRRATGTVIGRGDPEKMGGDGWMFCGYRGGLSFWAPPGGWRNR